MTYVLNFNDPWYTKEEPHTVPLQKSWIYSTRNQITTNILNPTIQWFSGQSSDADAKVTQKRLCGSYVEVIASIFLRSSSRTGWFLRDINGSFLLYVFFFFPLLPPWLLPVCWWVCLTRNLSFPCCVFFLCFMCTRYVSCAQYCQCPWTVHSSMPFRISLISI